MPTPAMWEKVRKKYHSATRIVLTWNPNRGTGTQVDWPWEQTEPPLYAIKWTVIGAPAWYPFDGKEKEELDKRAYADSFKKQKKPRGGNKRGQMDPRKL